VEKLILKNYLSPGDIVMLTAAVRDLHQCYPNEFLTDVRTSCAELWENNPYLTPLNERDPEVRVLECHYPLIERSNQAPYHCLHGFVEYINDNLGLQIRVSEFKGDIYLSSQERSGVSQIEELAGKDIPYWIVVAGGKFDVTVKWWETERYQAVVDHFKGRIQFVQVGQKEHHHPKLTGVIDLRGQTDLRQLVQLVYHAQGVLCPITAMMHLAAAVPTKEKNILKRPCVVVAGGREPAHWVEYPLHQFIHTVGQLKCCAEGGCWKSRTVPLGDEDRRDGVDWLCVDVVGTSPAACT
jgi:ADP-heptose:LPS heptosyltransferase